MKAMAKPLIAAAALLAIVMVSGCGGPKGPPTAATGGSTADAAGSGTSTAGDGTGTAGNNNLAQTPTAPGTSPPPDTQTTASAVSNTVILGPQFVAGSVITFKTILPGQSATLPVELGNISGQSITVVSVTAADAPFTTTTECNGRVIDPGGSCTFSVTFSPTDSGDYSSYLDIAAVPPAEGSTETSLKGSAGPSPGPSQAISPAASQLAPSEPTPADGSSP